MTHDLREHSLMCTLQALVQEVNCSLAGLEQAAKALASAPADVSALLERCYAQPDYWHDVSQSAYWHANGFAKFVLFGPASSPFRIRLHVWTGEPGQLRLQADQNVHGHRWDFGSAVIAGPGLQIDEYVESEISGAPYRSYAYRSARPADSSRVPEGYSDLELVGEVLLEPSVSFAPATNESYSCGIDRLHTVRTVSGDLTATMIVQGPVLLPSAPVFRRPEQGPQDLPRAMSEAEARRVFSATIEAARQWEASDDQPDR